MQTATLRGIVPNRNQADAAPNHYGVIDISGNGSTILGNVYHNYYTQPQDQQEPEHASTNCSRNVHWTISRSKNPYFTGRLDLIDKLSKIIRDALADNSRIEQCRIVITGMGGQGKSEICLQVAHHLRSIFWAVWWVDVSTLSSAQSDFRIVANQLHMPDSTIDDVRRALANLHHPWLLILDNADDIEVDYLQYFPTGHRGVVLLTSRNSECKQYGVSIAVALNGLPSVDARELLFRAAQIPQPRRDICSQDADHVASFLCGHPLATIQAGAYIQRGHCSLAEYPRVFQQNCKRLLKFRPAQARSRYGDVYATFEASAAAIRSMNTEVADDALQLLSMLAMLSSHQFPLLFFEQAWKGANKRLSPGDVDDYWRSTDLQAISFLPEFIGATEKAWDSYRLLEAVCLLEAYSLVTTNDVGDTKFVFMHPLAHAWAKDRQDNTLKQQSWLMIACSISVSSSSYWEFSPLDAGALHQQQLRPHLLALVNAEDNIVHGCGPQAVIVGILYRCGSLLADSGLNDQLSGLMQNVFSWLRIDMETVDPKWMPLYQLFARRVLIYHRPHEAITLQEQIVAISERELPGTDESRAIWPWHLATSYIDHYQYEKATKLLEKLLLEIEHKPIDKNAYYYLLMMNQLADTCYKLGQIQKAGVLLEKIAIRTNDQALDLNHRDRLECLCSLAETYRQFQQHQKAITTMEQVVAIREATLDESHPDRLLSELFLAVTYMEVGQSRMATSILEKVVTIQERTLFKSHPNLLSAQRALARAYCDSGELQKAIIILEEIVEIKGQNLVGSSRSLLDSQYDLARAYMMSGRAPRALPLLEKVVEFERSLLVEDDQHRLFALRALGIAHTFCGLEQNAVPIWEEIIRIEECILPEDDERRLQSQEELAESYHATGRLREALQTMQNVTNVRSRLLENQNPKLKESEDRLTYLEDLIMSRALDRVREDYSLRVTKIRFQDETLILNAESCPGTPLLTNSRSNQHVWLDDMVYIKPSSIVHRGFFIDDDCEEHSKYKNEHNEVSDDNGNNASHSDSVKNTGVTLVDSISKGLVSCL